MKMRMKIQELENQVTMLAPENNRLKQQIQSLAEENQRLKD